jgi:hypothetical protein
MLQRVASAKEQERRDLDVVLWVISSCGLVEITSISVFLPSSALKLETASFPKR